MIFKRPDLLTHMDIWFPRYHDQYKDGGERVVTLAKYKVDKATQYIIVQFSKAKHLEGQRFCVSRKFAQSCALDSNGKIAVYVVPMSKLERWDSIEEVKEIVRSFGW